MSDGTSDEPELSSGGVDGPPTNIGNRAAAASAGTPTSRVTDTRDVAVAAAQAAGARDVVKLRRIFAGILLFTLIFQIALADALFYKYGKAKDWEFPTAAISAWLAALVVQVVSLVYAIVRYLFSKEALEYARPEKKAKATKPGEGDGKAPTQPS